MRNTKKYIQMMKNNFPYEYLGLLPPKDQERVFDTFLINAAENLTTVESEIVKLYFGLNQENTLTLKEIGMKLNLTRERIRQIKENAVMSLRQGYIGILKDLADEEIDKRALENNDLGKRYYAKKLANFERNYKELENNYDILAENVKTILEKVSQYLPGKEGYPNILKLSQEKKLNALIENLDFSVRTEACLKRAGIKTVRDLVQKYPQELLKYVNFGIISLKEVEEKLGYLGLSLGMKLGDNSL